jgi:hypothetical protein
VGVDLLLVVGGYVLVVVEGGTFLSLRLVNRDLDAPVVLVDRGDLPRNEGASGAQEAHLHADVLGLVVLVDEQVVDLADLVAVAVVDGVVRVLVFDRREPVAALLHRCDLLA